ncbi:peptide chain release factor 2 [Patescibacteria group bacterium]|nr:peptide chain release factor 2 [Patescibacteria group bacterium]
MLNDLKDQLNDLKNRLDKAWQVLDLDTRKLEIDALEVEVSAPDFWSDQDRAKVEMQKLSDLNKEYADWSELKSGIDELLELIQMSEQDQDNKMEDEIKDKTDELSQSFAKLEFSMMFSGAHDASSAVMSIHAGAGGTDAQDWAEMLMRMYFRYAEKKDWTVKLVDESRGTEAGIKSVTFFVQGRYAYGHLKGEAGVHRLVRLSPFNADQLRQTSFALVEVLPEIDDEVKIEIKPEDLRIDTFQAGGHGGQSVNTTYSAVRIVHLPTKITVSCQNERSQTQNKETAMKILKAKLAKLKEDEFLKEKQQLRGEFHSAEWGNQIRSYVVHPYHLVKDLRTDHETTDTDAVLDGDLDAFVEAELRLDAGKKDVKAELNKD